MNAVLKDSSDIPACSSALPRHAPGWRRPRPRSGCDRIHRLLKATMAARPAILAAGQQGAAAASTSTSTASC